MSNPEPKGRLRRNAVLLAATGLAEYGLQFLLPIILVRNLTPDDFGLYRLVMLTATTALGIAPMLMPQSLYFFFPRRADDKGTVIGNVIMYLCVAGAVVALVTSPLNPAIGAPLRSLYAATRGLTSMFFWLWVIVSIATVLPIAEDRIVWFVASELSLALFRTLFLSLAAIYSHDIPSLIGVLGLEMLLRSCVLCAYLLTRKGARYLEFDFRLMLLQLKYSVPFAVGGALFMMRVQSDQWIVASMFSHSLFACFTVGAVVLPIASLVRTPINNAILPHISAAFAINDTARARQLILKGNLVTTLALLPIVGGLLLLAPEVIKLVYTERYIAAVPVMRVYLMGVVLQTIATGYALPSLNLGGFALKTNAFCLGISVVCSVLGAKHFGLFGAALGSVVAFAVGEVLNLRMICRQLHASVIDVLPLPLLCRIGTGVAAAVYITNAIELGVRYGVITNIILKMSVFAAVMAISFASSIRSFRIWSRRPVVNKQ